MPQAQTYQSEFTGLEMDARFTAVAQLTDALEALTAVVAQKYVKPASGIPSTDMDADVQAALAKANSAIQSLADYYTKTEVDQLLAAINGMDYVDVAALPTASASTMGKIYLVGPDGSGYYAYYYTSYDGSAYSWVGPLGTTQISLANYATKAEFSQLDQKVGDILSDYHYYVSPNLFNKEATTQGQAVRKDNGGLIASDTNYYSEYIKVPENAASVVYTGQSLSGVQGYACYNSSKQFTHGAAGQVITFREGDAYFRITVNASKLDTTMIIVGSSADDLPTDYIPYGDKWERDLISPDELDPSILQEIDTLKDAIGFKVDEQETYTDVSCATSPRYYKEILAYQSKGDNASVTIELYNIVGEYTTIRASWGSTYKNLTKLSNGNYRGTISLNGYSKGTEILIKVFTAEKTTTGSCDITIHEIAAASSGSVRAAIRERIDIFVTDTQLDIYNKMSKAATIGGMDVHFENGIYNFDETLYDYIKDTVGGSVGFELPIGGGCRYYFHGATLIGEYNGDNTAVHENCNVIGCRRTNGNFELHDGTIVANDIVYCVHDDVGADTTNTSHVHKHLNMHYIYNGGQFAANNYICKCIGGGTGLNLTVVIDKCILEKTTDNDDKNCVTYHGLASAPSAATTAKILITNTYMTGGCGAYHKAASAELETIQLIVSNCRTTAITHTDVNYYRAWNNTTT